MNETDCNKMTQNEVEIFADFNAKIEFQQNEDEGQQQQQQEQFESWPPMASKLVNNERRKAISAMTVREEETEMDEEKAQKEQQQQQHEKVLFIDKVLENINSCDEKLNANNNNSNNNKNNNNNNIIGVNENEDEAVDGVGAGDANKAKLTTLTTTTTTTTTVDATHNKLITIEQQQQQQQLLMKKDEPSKRPSSPYVIDESRATLEVLISTSPTSHYDDAATLLLQPLSERWSPLGANYDDAISPSSELLSPESELELLSSESLLLDKQMLGGESANELARLRSIEDEQELLTTSLMALTSHFAHVQLRVRQIVEAPVEERDQLLRDLEDFAFQGIPETTAITTAPMLCDGTPIAASPGSGATESQCLLIEQLKCQLTELEQLAYESGAPVLPQHMLLEKQKIIIDELKSKLNLKVDDAALPELSAEQLKSQVDNAIGEFVGPLKMKEQLVAQLKTQITDLERFIAFLQCDSDDTKLKLLSGVGGAGGIGSSEKLYEAYNSYAAKKNKTQKQRLVDERRLMQSAVGTATTTTTIITPQQQQQQQERQPRNNMEQNNIENAGELTATAAAPIVQSGVGSVGGAGGVRESLNSKAHGLLDKASLLMQMFATTHFTQTKREHFQKNSLKKTSKGNHWGDLRAQLEVDIQEVAALAATLSCDREKLAHVKRALKQQQQQQQQQRQAAAAATTTPKISRRLLNRPLTNKQPKRSVHELMPYQATTAAAAASTSTSSSASSSLSSTSTTLSLTAATGGVGSGAPSTAMLTAVAAGTSSESDEDASDRYDWEKACARRVLHMRGDSIATISKELTTVVRKNFARTLQQLIQHGLRVETESTTSSLIVPFMRCLNPLPQQQHHHHHHVHAHSTGAATAASSGMPAESHRTSFLAAHMPGVYAGESAANYDDVGRSSIFGYGRPMHAWELILEYYYLKHGDEYNNTPARKLSQSFNLDIIDAHAVTAKQSLLSAVGMIVQMHRPYKRSYNAHFKAFVCAGLNGHLLVEWLNLILSCNELIDLYYAPNSYVVRTGFRDSLRSIDALTKFDFDLPVDLAIRHFRNI